MLVPIDRARALRRLPMEQLSLWRHEQDCLSPDLLLAHPDDLMASTGVGARQQNDHLCVGRQQVEHLLPVFFRGFQASRAVLFAWATQGDQGRGVLHCACQNRLDVLDGIAAAAHLELIEPGSLRELSGGVECAKIQRILAGLAPSQLRQGRIRSPVPNRLLAVLMNMTDPHAHQDARQHDEERANRKRQYFRPVPGLSQLQEKSEAEEAGYPEQNARDERRAKAGLEHIDLAPCAPALRDKQDDGRRRERDENKNEKSLAHCRLRVPKRDAQLKRLNFRAGTESLRLTACDLPPGGAAKLLCSTDLQSWRVSRKLSSQARSWSPVDAGPTRATPRNNRTCAAAAGLD